MASAFVRMRGCRCGQGNPDAKNGCCTRPLVTKGSSCAGQLRKLCAADSPAQTRATMYAFSPGGCGGDPSKLTDPVQDIANFLLTRGPHAWLGHGWLGCPRCPLESAPAGAHATGGLGTA